MVNIVNVVNGITIHSHEAAVNAVRNDTGQQLADYTNRFSLGSRDDLPASGALSWLDCDFGSNNQ